LEKRNAYGTNSNGPAPPPGPSDVFDPRVRVNQTVLGGRGQNEEGYLRVSLVSGKNAMRDTDVHAEVWSFLREIQGFVEGNANGQVSYGDGDAVRAASESHGQALPNQGRSGASVSARSQDSAVLKRWGPVPRTGAVKKLREDCFQLHPMLMEFLSNVLLSTLTELRIVPIQATVKVIGMKLSFQGEEINALLLMDRALYTPKCSDVGRGVSVSNLFELIDVFFRAGPAPSWLDSRLNAAMRVYVRALSDLVQKYEFTHSDLKADNVLVHGKRKEIHLKIADLDKASFTLGNLRLAPLPPTNPLHRWAEPSHRSACTLDPLAFRADLRELCASMLLPIAARLGRRASLGSAWEALPKTFGTLLRKAHGKRMALRLRLCTTLLPVYSDSPRHVFRHVLSRCLFDDMSSSSLMLSGAGAVGALGAVLWAAHGARSSRGEAASNDA
jgi:hypothetical protein